MSYKKFVLGSLVLVAVIVTAFAVADAKKGDRPPAAPAQKAFLGVYLQDLDQDTQEALDLDSKEGVLIEDVVEESPADQADLQEQDIIISLDGQKVESSEEPKKAIALHQPGYEVKIVIIRNGKKKSLDVELGSSAETGEEVEKELELSLPEPGDLRTFSFSFPGFNRARMGVQIMDLTEQLGEYFGVEDGKGALITEVREDSPAEKAGLKAGDVIVNIGDDEIKNTSDVYQALEDKEKGDQVKVEVKRDKGRQNNTVTVQLEGQPQWHADAWGSKAPQFRKTISPKIKVFSDDDLDASQFKAELKELQKELKQLKKELEEMREELK